MRLRCSVFSAALFALAACSSAPAAPHRTPQSGDWTQFRLNPQHDATLPGSLRVAWRVQTDGGYSSSPAVVANTVYIGNNGGTLYALDLRTGAVRWRYHAATALMSNPLVWNGLVIAGEGNQQWVWGDRFHEIVVGTKENALLALDAASGRLRWRLNLAGTAMPTGAIVAGTLIQHNGAGLLTLADPADGSVRYTLDLRSGANMSAILPVGDDRFATSGAFENRVEERAARNGALIWTRSLRKEDWGLADCPFATDGRALFCDYVAPAPGTSNVYHAGRNAVEHAVALSTGDGRIAWDTPLESGPVPVWNRAAIPLIAGDTLYVGAANSPFVHAIRTSDGRVRWRVRVHGPVKSGIARKDGVLYFGDFGGYLWAVDARTGKVIGTKNAHTQFNVGSPVIVGNSLIVGSNTGAVIAMPLDDVRSSHDGI
ncbi:MAG TPA: PQQ-binding-like beta-propeller repeat protein [Candidatus Baltobacteraceae bacterium]|jgi:outer membrane protein assembly factor BamB